MHRHRCLNLKLASETNYLLGRWDVDVLRTLLRGIIVLLKGPGVTAKFGLPKYGAETDMNDVSR
jgi:hypothetical protein